MRMDTLYGGMKDSGLVQGTHDRPQRPMEYRSLVLRPLESKLSVAIEPTCGEYRE